MKVIKTQKTKGNGKFGRQSKFSRYTKMKNTTQLLFMIGLCGFLCMDYVFASIRIGNISIDSSKDTVIAGANISGLICYEAQSHTIIMQDASITMPDTISIICGGINIYDEGTVNIKIFGNNTITGIVPIEITHTLCKIYGTGKLLLVSPYEDSWGGIFFWALYPWFNNPNGLVISEGCQVEIQTPHAVGIYTRSNPNYPYTMEDRCNINIINSTLIVNAGKGAVWHAKALLLEDCHIEYPSNAFFSVDSGVIMDNTGLVSNRLEIKPGTMDVPVYDTNVCKVIGSKNGIYLRNVSENATARIFNISGCMVRTLRVTKKNEFVPLNSGVYIVNIKGCQRKVIVF